MNNTKIEWTDHTFNPWWGCVKVSDGCKNCYANSLDKRYGGNHWGPNSERRFFGDKHWAEPLKWNKEAEAAGVREKVFCASMADVFEDRADLTAERKRLFGLIQSTPHLDWLLLTKRPENVAKAITDIVGSEGRTEDNYHFQNYLMRWLVGEPPHNVWLGTSVEDQKAADERIPILCKVPAAVHFLSCEPLLSPVDISEGGKSLSVSEFGKPIRWERQEIAWVIVGCESGPKRRHFEEEWVRDIYYHCKAGGVSFFNKQMIIDGKVSHNIEEFPKDLRVREFPKVAIPT